MKKKLCALILAMACVCSLGTTGASAAGMDEQEGYSTTVISGEDAIGKCLVATPIQSVPM